ncbi:MAG: hypothetical protein RL277_891 [Planctomycetota bacterium]
MTKTWNQVLSLGTALAGAAILSLDAQAQTPCQGATGPDVIVGDIQDVANYASLNGVEALALGTYSCNQGTQTVSWISNNNLHPVIGGNLYKYKVVNGSGRFEHLGMSWLKHGFFALSNNLCCTGCQSTSGSSLGIRCADPYTAARNGSQSGAGPKWQVNASTGVFTYPPANPAFSGSTARRLQVKITDLEASSASVRYFGEAQYVTQDDAAAGNDNNNASYRELTVTGSGTAWTFSLTAGQTTQREKPAILAWQAIDPTVQVQNIDTDGRLILAWKVTEITPGTWHYEYALQNLNSDRSVQAFSLPVGGAMLTNIGFHDVDYHSGDGIGNVTTLGTDWAVTNTAGTLAWATDTFAVNQNANALRWGTLYNFRFDANVPPTSGSITLTPFKSGSNLVVTAQVPSAAPGGPIALVCDPGAGGIIACPCANPALGPGQGCDNSSSTGGAMLTAAGNAALSSDTVVINAIGEKPTATSILLQGDNLNATGTVFGQGIRCVAGSLKRLYVKNAVGGAVTMPGAGDPTITARATALGDTLAGGSVRYYGIYYRDPIVLGGCAASSTFNITNQASVTWNP